MKRSALHRLVADPRHPLGAHVGLIVAFNAGLLSLAWASGRRHRWTERPSIADLALLGVGSFKLSRLLVTDRVTLPIRAPFVTDVEDEEPAGTGLRRALGELLTCPHCVAPWCTLALGAGLQFAPYPTRLVCGLLGAMTMADVMHRGYAMLTSRQQVERKAAEEASDG